MAPKIDGNGTSRAGLWLSIATSAFILLGMVGSMFYVAFLGKSNSDALAVQIVINQTLSNEIRGLQLKQGEQEIAMNEIETQFCAQDIVRNLMHAEDLRKFSILYDKVLGERLPTDNSYYPTICNRKVKQ